MSASLRLRVGVVAAGLLFLALSYTVAQQVQSPGQTRLREIAPNASGQTDRSSTQQYDRSTSRTANYRGEQANAGGQSQAVEHFPANRLLFQNQAEVQLSELAQQKADNADVKQFAQQMVEDHRKMIEQLQPLASMQGGANRAASGVLGTQNESASNPGSSNTTGLPGASDADQTIPPSGTTAAAPSIGTTTDVTAGATATDRIAHGNSALHQLGQIERQIGERCVQAAKDEMQQKSGAEFDKCYVGSAIGAHMHVLAELEVIGQQTQGPLAQLAQQAQPKVKEHLDHAKQLMKQLEEQAGAAGTQAERKSTTRTE